MFPNKSVSIPKIFISVHVLLKKIPFDQVALRTKPVYVFEHIYAFSTDSYFWSN